MKTASINRGYLQQHNLRFEGEHYLNDNAYLSMHMETHCDKCKHLDELALVFNPPVFKRQFCNKTPRSVQYFQSSDVNNASEESSVHIFKGQAESLNLLVKHNDILVTGFGSIGNTRLVSILQDGVCYANNVCRVRTNAGIKAGYLYACMSSKYSTAQLNNNASGSVVRYIEAPGIKKTLIPNFPESFQQQVDDLIQESAKLREEATSSLRIAISLFEQKNVDYFINNTNSKHKIISISNIINNHKRLDSTYQLWLSDLSNYNQTVVQRHTCKIQVLAKDIFIGNRGKRNYTEQGIPFISSSDMMLFNPIKYAKRIGTKTPNLSSMLVKQGDILISRSGTVGNTALVSNTLLDCAVSEHAMRLRIAEGEITPEYIFCYFNTKEGKRYLENLAYGSVIITLGEEFIGDIDLPILSDDAQREITKHIRDYSIKIDTAIELENKATNLIEAEIEKWNN